MSKQDFCTRFSFFGAKNCFLWNILKFLLTIFAISFIIKGDNVMLLVAVCLLHGNAMDCRLRPLWQFTRKKGRH